MLVCRSSRVSIDSLSLMKLRQSDSVPASSNDCQWVILLRLISLYSRNLQGWETNHVCGSTCRRHDSGGICRAVAVGCVAMITDTFWCCTKRGSRGAGSDYSHLPTTHKQSQSNFELSIGSAMLLEFKANIGPEMLRTSINPAKHRLFFGR